MSINKRLNTLETELQPDPSNDEIIEVFEHDKGETRAVKMTRREFARLKCDPGHIVIEFHD